MNDGIGKLILRLALGVLVLLHGIAKIQGGIDGIAGMLTNVGMPAAIAYGVYIGEVIAPLLLILGFYARVGAALIAVNMLVALALVHQAELGVIGQTGGWALELQGMFLFSAVALAFMGPGRLAVNQR